MKGNNRIVVNPATMVEAMQEYLDRRAVGGKADKVDTVAYVPGNGSSEYHFGVSERKQETK